MLKNFVYKTERSLKKYMYQHFSKKKFLSNGIIKASDIKKLTYVWSTITIDKEKANESIYGPYIQNIIFTFSKKSFNESLDFSNRS